MLTHKDIQPWNLLSREGRPVVLDWELSGMLDLASELGSTALSLAKGPGFDHIEPAIFRSVLDGYVAGGGELPPSGPSWFCVHDQRLAGVHEVEHPPLPSRCRGEHRP